MIQTAPPPSPTQTAAESEQLMVLHGITWEQYIAVDAALTKFNARLAYLDGDLEIVSPVSKQHGGPNYRFAMLLPMYFAEHRIEFSSWLDISMQQKPKMAGVQPDEAYNFGSEKEFPDLVIEIVVTSGGIDSLEAYRRYGVSEVWFWQNGKLSIYSLQNDKYVAQARSQLLPSLDVDLLARCLKLPSYLEAIYTFRDGLSKAKKG